MCDGSSSTVATTMTSSGSVAPPAIVVNVQALPVHYIRDARPTVRRAKQQRVGLELSYSSETQFETCENEFWEQAQAEGQEGTTVVLQVSAACCLCARERERERERESQLKF